MVRTLSRVVLCSAAFAGLGMGASCGGFLAEEAGALDAGTTDGPIASDAPAGDDGGPAPSDRCPLARAPSCLPTLCTQQTLYENESAPGAPWGIAVDQSSVYWLEQPANNDGYNGHAHARVLRTSKQPGPDKSRAHELAVGQASAVTIALAGDWVYWTVYETNDAGHSFTKLRRARKDCTGKCEVEELLVPAQGVRVVKLVATAPDRIFGLGESGHVFRFDVGGVVMAQAPAPLLVMPGRAALVATDQHLYLSSANSATIARMGLDGSNVEQGAISIAPHDGAEPGLTHMWTDCTDVWARRGPATQIVSFPLADPVVETRVESVPMTLYDVAGDAKYLYYAGANEGVFVYERSGSSPPTRIGGDKAFAIAVDSDGVYWGEHKIESPLAGAIYKLVK